MKFRLSLRSLLLVTAMGAIALWLVFKPTIDQRMAVSRLLKTKSQVRFEEPNRHVPKWMIALLGKELFCPVTTVRINGLAQSDRDLSVLDDLPNLVYLTIDNLSISSQGFERIAKLQKVENLALLDCSFEAQSLALLAQHPSLRNLEFYQGTETDELTAVLALCKARVLFLPRSQSIGRKIEPIAR